MGHDGTNWELGFKQYSFHHAFQVLRVCNCSAFSLPPAFPPCSCPLAFRHQVRRLTSGRSSDFPSTCVVIQHALSWRIKALMIILEHQEDPDASSLLCACLDPSATTRRDHRESTAFPQTLHSAPRVVPAART